VEKKRERRRPRTAGRSAGCVAVGTAVAFFQLAGPAVTSLARAVGADVGSAVRFRHSGCRLVAHDRHPREGADAAPTPQLWSAPLPLALPAASREAFRTARAAGCSARGDIPRGNICNRRRGGSSPGTGADHRTGDRYASSGNRREERYDIGQGQPAGKALDKGAACRHLRGVEVVHDAANCGDRETLWDRAVWSHCGHGTCGHGPTRAEPPRHETALDLGSSGLARYRLNAARRFPRAYGSEGLGCRGQDPSLRPTIQRMAHVEPLKQHQRLRSVSRLRTTKSPDQPSVIVRVAAKSLTVTRPDAPPVASQRFTARGCPPTPAHPVQQRRDPRRRLPPPRGAPAARRRANGPSGAWPACGPPFASLFGRVLSNRPQPPRVAS
jgi:hypothetical protein